MPIPGTNFVKLRLFLYSITLSLSKPEDTPQTIKTIRTVTTLGVYGIGRQPRFEYAIFVRKSVV